jgi:hypothetical protein
MRTSARLPPEALGAVADPEGEAPGEPVDPELLGEGETARGLPHATATSARATSEANRLID